MGNIGTNRLTLPLDQLKAVIQDGLADPDHLVREVTLFGIMGRASGRSTDRSEQRAAQWRSERATLLSLKDDVVAALSDQNERVRAAAALALVHLTDASDVPGPQLRIETDTIDILTGAYQKETSPYNRSEIIRYIALSEPDSSKPRRDLLVSALSDPADSVISRALKGAAAARILDVLPEAARLLAHPDWNVRLAAAQALAMYGRDAQPYLASLRAALATETDEVVRRTLEGTIQMLERP